MAAQDEWTHLQSAIDGVLHEPARRPAELATVMPEDLRDAAWVIGVESGLARSCGLDWRAERYAPMMAIAASSGIFDTRQLDGLSTWHAAAQAAAEEAARTHGGCSPQLRAWLGARGLHGNTEPVTG